MASGASNLNITDITNKSGRFKRCEKQILLQSSFECQLRSSTRLQKLLGYESRLRAVFFFDICVYGTDFTSVCEIDLRILAEYICMHIGIRRS